jgi:hypothetical protein
MFCRTQSRLEESPMPKSYYSMVLDHPAEKIRAVIREFDRYAWAGVPDETLIEAGKRGDQASAIRRVKTDNNTIRQILNALDPGLRRDDGHDVSGA